jgi:excisionase family DNA binding protein
MGHALHPLMTDLPIGCWTSAALLDAVGGRGSRSAARRLIGLGLLFVPAAALSGLADYRSVPDRATRRVGGVHAMGNTLAAGLYLASWQRRRTGRHVAGVALGLAGGGVAAFTGYLGGHMSFARSSGTGARGSMIDRSMTGGSMIDGQGVGAPGDEWVGVEEAAELLTVPVEQVHNMIDEGMLTVVGQGDHVRFALSEVLATRQLGG